MEFMAYTAMNNWSVWLKGILSDLKALEIESEREAAINRRAAELILATGCSPLQVVIQACKDIERRR